MQLSSPPLILPLRLHYKSDPSLSTFASLAFSSQILVVEMELMEVSPAVVELELPFFGLHSQACIFPEPTEGYQGFSGLVVHLDNFHDT